MADADVLEKSQVFLGEENVPWKDEEEVIPFDIYTACSLGEHNFVRVLLSKGMSSSELNSCNCGGWTALMYAAYVGHDNVVNLLLDADVNVNVKSRKSGSTPLMLAASCGNESVAYFLLQVIFNYCRKRLKEHLTDHWFYLTKLLLSFNIIFKQLVAID